MNKKMKFVSIAAAMAMAASMGVSAFAASAPGTPGGEVGGATTTDNGTEVWAGVAVDNPDMRIKVTVPTLFAFVVNGTVDSQHADKAISATDGGLLLPNVKVENVSGTGTTDDTYDLTTTGDGNLTFDNYSTYYDSTGSTYKGLEVKLQGSITNEAGSKWTHSTAKPNQTQGNDKYKYHLTVNGQEFTTLNADGSHGMADKITLTAPTGVDTANNLDQTTKLAQVPSQTAAEFGVDVGGARGDYNVAENSAKIGTITWQVSTQRTVPNAT